VGRILVVDDEQPIRHLLRAILTSAGYEVIEAADGEQGFNTALDEKPDLIIADIMMPIKDGYELAHDLCSSP
jgi:DNA-binding response OmpR family regulator